MKILLIRHGLTAGNLRKCYIGRTDEPLCTEGKEQLSKLDVQPCDILVCSPMKRCIQSADIIFHGQEYIISKSLAECDFGDFEGKNYTELSENDDYQKWIDSGGNAPFPSGESPQDFRERSCCAFYDIVRNYSNISSAAFVVHGGTIMSVLEKYAVPHKDYFDWICENGHGYVCEWNGSEIYIMEKI